MKSAGNSAFYFLNYAEARSRECIHRRRKDIAITYPVLCFFVIALTIYSMMASIQVQNSQSQLSSVNQDTIGSSSIDNNISGKSLVNSAIAGYAAGSCGVIFGHPLDSAKVWLQTNTAGQNKYFSTSSNTTNNTTKFKRPPTVISPKPAGTAATMSTLTGSASTMTGESSIFLRKITSTLRALYSGVSAPLISGRLT
jgi:hypothetical protein